MVQKQQKRFILVLVLLLSTAALATSVWAAGESEETTPASTLRIGTPNEVKAANIFSDYYLGIFAHISNPPLMKMSSDGVLEGLTADGFETSKNGSIWRFRIRDDLYWSDGQKLTAEDVRFSIEYTGNHNPSARWIKDTLKDSRVEGENTVVLVFNKPYTTLDLEFATYNIFPKHIWQDISDPMQTTGQGPNVGHGPFVIESIDLEAGVIRFEGNPYWKGQQPTLDGFEIHMYKNMDVLSLALEKGEVDTYYKYASSYPYANIDRLKETGRFEFVEQLNMGLVFLGFNLRRMPGADRSFREALTYAIDYEEILTLDALGFGQTPGRGFVPPSMGGYQSTPSLSHDPQKAKQLLASADYRDMDGNEWIEDPSGRELELEVLVRSDWTRVGELLVDYLSKVGIRAQLRSVELNSWVAEKDSYNYDLTITRTTPWGMLMHAGWGSGYFDSRRSGRGVLHILEDPEFLELCDQILATADPEQRISLGRRIQEYFARELPAVPLYWNMIVTPFNRVFTGWKPDPLYGIYNVDTLLSVKKKTTD
jgi:peptide/nickel transport system substrate-binding protein